MPRSCGLAFDKILKVGDQPINAGLQSAHTRPAAPAGPAAAPDARAPVVAEEADGAQESRGEGASSDKAWVHKNASALECPPRPNGTDPRHCRIVLGTWR